MTQGQGGAQGTPYSTLDMPKNAEGCADMRTIRFLKLVFGRLSLACTPIKAGWSWAMHWVILRQSQSFMRMASSTRRSETVDGIKPALSPYLPTFRNSQTLESLVTRTLVPLALTHQQETGGRERHAVDLRTEGQKHTQKTETEHREACPKDRQTQPLLRI